MNKGNRTSFIQQNNKNVIKGSDYYKFITHGNLAFLTTCSYIIYTYEYILKSLKLKSIARHRRSCDLITSSTKSHVSHHHSPVTHKPTTISIATSYFPLIYPMTQSPLDFLMVGLEAMQKIIKYTQSVFVCLISY